MRAIKGRRPSVRLLTAGRVFRPEHEDGTHLKVFNQADGICVASDAIYEKLVETLNRLLSAVLGQVELQYTEMDFGIVDRGKEVYVMRKGDLVSVAGCGMLKPEMLREAGHDPRVVSGFAFGLGLERLAMIKYGIDDVNELWRPPYVQPKV